MCHDGVLTVQLVSSSRGEGTVQVAAFSTPSRPDWRWRIVTYAGEVVEESLETFATIADALARGSARLRSLDIVDRSTAPNWRRSTSHLRRP